MPKTPPERPVLPKVRPRVFARRTDVPEGPFYAMRQGLAGGPEMGEPTDEEIAVLAQLIHSAYLEWKRR